jgi:hypothetical protein
MYSERRWVGNGMNATTIKKSVLITRKVRFTCEIWPITV